MKISIYTSVTKALFSKVGENWLKEVLSFLRGHLLTSYPFRIPWKLCRGCRREIFPAGDRAPLSQLLILSQDPNHLVHYLYFSNWFFCPQTFLALSHRHVSLPYAFTLPEIPSLPIFSQRNPSPPPRPSSHPVSREPTRTITSHALLTSLSCRYRTHWCAAAGAVIFFLLCYLFP